MSQQAVRVGLIGVDKMGQNHLRVLSLLKAVELRFIYDADTRNARRLAALHGVEAAEDLDDAFSSIDAAIICTPTSTHAEYIERAAKHVTRLFVEKPLAETLHRSEEVCRLIESDGLTVQIGFIERFNPAVQQLKR